LTAELIKTHSFKLFFWPFCPLSQSVKSN